MADNDELTAHHLKEMLLLKWPDLRISLSTIKGVEDILVGFQQNFADGHRFWQDNDPKHTSKFAQGYFKQKNINWWQTPPESPDLNPIEKVWDL